jgi:hypothetical protein
MVRSDVPGKQLIDAADRVLSDASLSLPETSPEICGRQEPVDSTFESSHLSSEDIRGHENHERTTRCSRARKGVASEDTSQHRPASGTNGCS